MKIFSALVRMFNKEKTSGEEESERLLTELDEEERRALEDEIHSYDFALLDGSMSREEHNKVVRKLIDDAFRMHDQRK